MSTVIREKFEKHVESEEYKSIDPQAERSARDFALFVAGWQARQTAIFEAHYSGEERPES